jgi:hypothetical protein
MSMAVNERPQRLYFAVCCEQEICCGEEICCEEDLCLTISRR